MLTDILTEFSLLNSYKLMKTVNSANQLDLRI